MTHARRPTGAARKHPPLEARLGDPTMPRFALDMDRPTDVSLAPVRSGAGGRIYSLYDLGSAEGEKANARGLEAVSESMQTTK
jgi:hypothetical protein